MVIRHFMTKFGTHVTGPGFCSGKPGPESLVGRLENGEGVKIFGLRRIGKSSLLYETARLLAGRQRQIIELDGQQLHSIPILVKETSGRFHLKSVEFIACCMGEETRPDGR